MLASRPAVSPLRRRRPGCLSGGQHEDNGPASARSSNHFAEHELETDRAARRAATGSAPCRRAGPVPAWRRRALPHRRARPRTGLTDAPRSSGQGGRRPLAPRPERQRLETPPRRHRRALGCAPPSRLGCAPNAQQPPSGWSTFRPAQGGHFSSGLDTAYGWLARNAERFGFIHRYAWASRRLCSGPEPVSRYGPRAPLSASSSTVSSPAAASALPMVAGTSNFQIGTAGRRRRRRRRRSGRADAVEVRDRAVSPSRARQAAVGDRQFVTFDRLAHGREFVGGALHGALGAGEVGALARSWSIDSARAVEVVLSVVAVPER